MLQFTIMQAYFSASLKGKDKFNNSFCKIIEILKKFDCKVYSDHVMNRDHKTVNKQTPAEHEQDYYTMREQVENSQFLIAESTHPSIGLGHILTIALNHHKPCLLLTQEEPHGLLIGDPDGLLTIAQYQENKWDELEEKIKLFLIFHTLSQ